MVDYSGNTCNCHGECEGVVMRMWHCETYVR
jgi:hypothetical protein